MLDLEEANRVPGEEGQETVHSEEWAGNRWDPRWAAANRQSQWFADLDDVRFETKGHARSGRLAFPSTCWLATASRHFMGLSRRMIRRS
jgi:hypothetical protein